MASRRTSRIVDAIKSQVLPEESDACPWLDPGEKGARLGVEDYPTFLILRLASVAKTHVTKRYLDRFDISLPEWRLLALIARFSPLPFGDVAAGSSMDKGQVSRTLQTIAKRGLVRINSVGANKRARTATSLAPRIEVVITPKGRALCERIVPVAREHQMKIIELMSASEMRVFYSVARRLMKQIPELAEE